ncbi:conserved unknown protein [Ectocarpus siliculosus]|uniref:Mediator of RNA polymerase II transcription subunit 31 n=1 Tax=Ectocarpus siliculosus TaxID=2880 RepID=D7FV80_ECTSI|nr:conserved unknown protein [Ectocarpus siliculosus]|eukprot:CBJ26252.1 conserved unknown protein [Ectocarpus siliculosus]
MEGSGTRFEMELELMNCLASPEYLHYLAQGGYLDDRAFIRFLEYLQYFKRPEYAKFITYPHSLAMLDLLINNPPFRKCMNALLNCQQQLGYNGWARQGLVLVCMGDTRVVSRAMLLL